MSFESHTRAIFDAVTKSPRLVLAVGLLVFVVAAAGLPRLQKDTSIDAFVPPGHSSLLANEEVDARFGLTEPIAVAVFTADGRDVFQPRAMQLVHAISEELKTLENLREDRIATITTESSIRADGDAIQIDRYFSRSGSDAEELRESKRRWLAMTPHINTLVSADARGAVIMAEVIDSRQAASTYKAVNEVIDGLDADLTVGFEVLVAGPAAVSGYLSSAINKDARLLQPAVFLVVMLFLYLAFMRLSALLGPLVVLLGAVGGAMGCMAWNGVSYFAITNALPVILVAIAVADAIHILSQYFTRRASDPERPVRQVIVDAMVSMARPITLTTITTMAGFLGIAATSIMPPISYFAVFATLGVFLAWAFSLFVLPAALVLVQPRPSALFRSWEKCTPDRIGSWLTRTSLAAATNPATTITLFLALTGVALLGAMDLRIDRSQVENFRPDEPLRIADERIHESFAGTAFLDVVVTTDEADGLLEAERMQKIVALQEYIEGLPHVSKTVSITDYLSTLHAALEDYEPTSRRLLPDSNDAIAQYLMLYEASGDPSDLDEEITPDYDAALVRIVLDSHLFSDSREVVSALQIYLDEQFNDVGLRGLIAGDVNVAYHWMTGLRVSHFAGVALSLGLILVFAVLLFRSFWLGFFAVIPVSFTVLVMYGLMGFTGVYLEPATSMFAAISLGVGVDFAIHLIDGLREARDRGDGSLRQIIERAVPVTARACLFNAAALGLGFAVLMLSGLPTLQRFGALVAVAAFSSFIVALIVIPACFALLYRRRARPVLSTSVSVVILLGALATLLSDRSEAMSADAVARKVAERREAPALIRTIRMTIEDKRGRVRQREAVVFRRNDVARRETRITYLAPKPVRELTFLSRDFRESGRADLRWLYLPAARKVRRIPASDRGDYFLGTDFTYEDVQSDLKFDLADYKFALAQTPDPGQYRLAGRTVSGAVAAELGYGQFEATIDAESWFPTEVVFFNQRDQLLKTIKIHDLHQIDGVWSAGAIEATHHRKQHKTRFDYLDVQHFDTLPESWFEANVLNRGLPDYEAVKP
ncbi:MAG: outer membrane lipoprotein-sorting protein [Pseudomonadota bacterium]